MKNFLVSFEVSCPDGLLATIKVAMKANIADEAVKAAKMLVSNLAVFKGVVEVVGTGDVICSNVEDIREKMLKAPSLLPEKPALTIFCDVCKQTFPSYIGRRNLPSHYVAVTSSLGTDSVRCDQSGLPPGTFYGKAVTVETKDSVNHPAHYGGKDNPYEAIKVIEAWELGFCLGNTVKYISRAGKKDAAKIIEDLKKASWYLSREISRLEKDGK